MKYSVSIRYDEFGFGMFCFYDGLEALDFAKVAAMHIVKSKDEFSKSDVPVMIEIDPEKEENNNVDV